MFSLGLKHLDYKEDCCACLNQSISSQVTQQYLEMLHVLLCGNERSTEARRKKKEIAFWLALEVIIINNYYIMINVDNIIS